jgi:hypothetical protein
MAGTSGDRQLTGILKFDDSFPAPPSSERPTRPDPILTLTR